MADTQGPSSCSSILSEEKGRKRTLPSCHDYDALESRSSHPKLRRSLTGTDVTSITDQEGERSLSYGAKLAVCGHGPMHPAIKGELHMWKAYTVEIDLDGLADNTDIFEFLPFKRAFTTADQFLELLKKFLYPLDANAKKRFDRHLRQAQTTLGIIHDSMDFSITSAPGQSGATKGKIYHMYPKMITDGLDRRVPTTVNVISDLYASIDNSMTTFYAAIEAKKLLQCSELEKVRDEQSFADVKKFFNAVQFMEETMQFLVQQGSSITERQHERLFASFSAVAGLDFGDACCISSRKMTILGQGVSGRPDLRALVPILPQVKTESTTKYEIWKNPRAVVAVVEVKTQESKRVADTGTRRDVETRQGASSQSAGAIEAEACIIEVLGQLTGDMIAELLSGEAHNEHVMIGFTVQCTKVQLVLMEMPESVKAYITSEPTCSSKGYNGEDGKIYFTASFDMLVAEDRKTLWMLIAVVAAATSV